MSTPSGPTYTYSGDPSTSPKDTIRFLAQATGENKETGFVSDEEIAWIRTQEPNVYLAAAMVAERVSAHFGAQRSKTVGPLQISGREQSATYASLAEKLRAQASNGGTAGAEFTGNTSVIFDIGIHDYAPSGIYVNPANDLLGGGP
ncbi:hypothetical protein [Streptomyces sp. NPDC006477]|uniref:hypothetical protein n=1 Tax=Streptomyces sp. NPDC006477 TaxID=3364747 RepID=UPI00368DE715